MGAPFLEFQVLFLDYFFTELLQLLFKLFNPLQTRLSHIVIKRFHDHINHRGVRILVLVEGVQEFTSDSYLCCLLLERKSLLLELLGRVSAGR